jgi:2,4-diketo-3-deoxy-L-fuconate hydrolase
VIGPADPIAFDARISQKWDYEAELVVIGKAGRSIPASKAMDHVFGFCLANDLSARDLQRRHGGQWLKGKSIDGTMPLGPHIVTRGENDLSKVRLECFVNGEQRQDALVAPDGVRGPRTDRRALVRDDVEARRCAPDRDAGRRRLRPHATAVFEARHEVVVRGAGLGELRNVATESDLYGEATISLEIPV